MRETLLLALLVSCSASEEVLLEHECDDAMDRVMVVDCMVKCASAANPKSDEEGEDLVAQCDSSCTKMVCPLRAVRYRREWHDGRARRGRRIQ